MRLPAIDAPNFEQEYQRLSTPTSSAPTRATPAPGSIGALVVAYRSGSEFGEVPSATTRANYRRYLDLIEADHGARSVTGVRPAHIYRMRDKFAETPGKANNWLTVFRVLMAYAAKHDWRGDNPASGIKALRIGEYEPWPADLLRVCLEVATPITRMLLVAGLCSGQRNSDVIRMQYGWIEDGVMSLTQAKTNVHVSVPMHPFWTAELAAQPRKAVTLLYDRFGKPFGTTGAVQSRIRDLMEMKPVKEVLADLTAREMIGEGDTFVFHGLRKNACCYLLETGKNDSEVGAMLGMSAAMVRHYGKRALALMIAKTTAAELVGGKLIMLPGVNLVQFGPVAL
ncbi:tyrosine-type recombinase/integrase [Sphingomonas prati]|uniref:Integrase n=1 Tax=Sphingomonas prati TaxID=1843237 RepID=A0A7W9BV34_9SPHN|nr:hypothetical protein [Sphingomonas prati]MBB5730434.1 integrase [Sphingomonas prati]GGE94050.1 hypothetical protein GCM10011404_28870 [Sphingomonas prati]